MKFGMSVGSAIVPWGRNRELFLGRKIVSADEVADVITTLNQKTAGRNFLVVDAEDGASVGYQLLMRTKGGLDQPMVAGEAGESGYKLVAPFNRAFVHTARSGVDQVGQRAQMAHYQQADTPARTIGQTVRAAKAKLAVGAATALALAGASQIAIPAYEASNNRAPSNNDVLDAVDAPRPSKLNISKGGGFSAAAELANHYSTTYGGDDLLIDPKRGEAQRTVEFEFNGRRYTARLDLTDTVRLAANRDDHDGKASNHEINQVITDTGFFRLNRFLKSGGERVVPGSVKPVD